MNVFCDLHHADLYYSLQLLFEKRLKFKMYRPIGLEWYQQNLWKVYDHPATAQQFLGFNHIISAEMLERFNKEDIKNIDWTESDDYYLVKSRPETLQKAVTLEQFKNIKFDIVIASIPQHIPIYQRLISLYQPQAKLVFQIGNSWGHQSGVSNLLASCAPFIPPAGVNAIFYHQEFDLETFNYTNPATPLRVDSYIHYMQKMDLFNSCKIHFPNVQWHTHGAGMEDCLHGAKAISDTMKTSGWTWHVKPEGDGFGHILHNSYACGRPAIVMGSYYRGKLAELLLEDMVTCIDLSSDSFLVNVAKIKHCLQPEIHTEMCKNAYNRFKSVVDYDKEEQEIRTFISNLR